MTRRRRVALGVLVAGATLPAGGGGGPAARDAEPVRETLDRGLVVELPRFGRLTWRCADKRRFTVRIDPPRPVAEFEATVVSDGRTVVRRRRIRGPYATPLARVREQRWRMVWHHVPAEKRAAVLARFAVADNGDCFVRVARTRVATDSSG